MELSSFTPGSALVVVVALALAPFFAVMVTSFTKIVVTLSLLRNALGLQQVPPNIVLNGLALILDFVPNHMGVHFSDNAWWQDVLEWGPKSVHAKSFDIDWDMLPHRSKPGVLVPILGSSYGEALEKGEQVKLSGFGNFDLRQKNQRPGRNPKTGEEIPISARRVVTFRPGQKLKVRVEGYAGSRE